MAMVSVSRDRLANGLVPRVCVVCGEPAAQCRFGGVAGRAFGRVVSLPLIGPLILWAYILFVGIRSRFAPQRSGGLPFCDRHLVYWPRRAFYLILGFIATLILIGIAIAVAPPIPQTRTDKPHWLFFVIGLWILGYIVVFRVIHTGSIRPIGGNRGYVVLCGVSRTFAEGVESRKTGRKVQSGPQPAPKPRPPGASVKRPQV